MNKIVHIPEGMLDLILNRVSDDGESGCALVLYFHFLTIIEE